MSGFGFMSGEQIYQNFQQGTGPEGLSGSAAMVKEMAARYRDRVDFVHQLKARMEAAWQGDASGAAQRGLGPLVTEHDAAGHALGVAQDLTGGQAGSFGDAKNQVVPVPDAPTSIDPLAMVTDPAGVVTAMEQIQAQNEAAQHNVDVMNGYATVSKTNTEGQPETFGTLTGDQAGVSVGSPSSGMIDSDDYRESDSDSEADSEGGPAGGDGSPDIGGTGAESASPPGYGAPAGQPNGADAGVTTPGAFTQTTGTGPLTNDGLSNVGRPTGGSVAGLGVGVAPVGGPGGGGGGMPRGGGFPGGAPRGGLPGGVGGLGAQEPGATGRSGGLQPYGSSGPGRGGVGFGGAPIGGAGRGQSEDDRERKTPPYLEGGDPEELFDTDLLTAPPVIGGPDDE